MNIVNTLRKEKPMLIKLLYGTVICVLSFRLPAKVARLSRKTNEAEIRAVYNVLYGNYNYVSFRTFNNEKPIEVAISSKIFAPYATLSLTLSFVLVVSDVMCVFPAETVFLNLAQKPLNCGVKYP